MLQMEQISVCFPPDTMKFLRVTAERECRTIGAQIRYYVEAARRAGNPAPAGDNPSGNPPLPIVSPATMPQVKAELAELDAETARLAAEQNRLGYKFGPHDERRLSYIRGRAAVIRRHVEIVEGARNG